MERFGISSRPQHLGGLLSYQAERRQDAEFAIFVEDQRRVTFGEANRMANRFGHGLHRAGIEQRAPVCLMMPNAWEMLISEYGVHKIGAVAVEINADFRGRALARDRRRVPTYADRQDREVAAPARPERGTNVSAHGGRPLAPPRELGSAPASRHQRP